MTSTERRLTVDALLDHLAEVKVQGTTMDYHGAEVPSTESLRQLEWRRVGETNTPFYGEGVLVGLVDGGFFGHPWLEGGYLASPNEFLSYFPNPDTGIPAPRTFEGPFSGHATFVAGLILQQAPAAGVWVEKALKDGGTGFGDAVLTAATTLVKRGVHILNLSLGCTEDDPEFGDLMKQLVDRLLGLNPELVIVASAGNKKPKDEPAKVWPAALPRVIGVGSVLGDKDADFTTPAEWSNDGDWLTFMANGHRVLSTYLDGVVPVADTTKKFEGWAKWSGTSFSTAIVSGAIARAMTEYSADGEHMSALDAVERLKRKSTSLTPTGVPVVARELWDDHLYGAGVTGAGGETGS